MLTVFRNSLSRKSLIALSIALISTLILSACGSSAPSEDELAIGNFISQQSVGYVTSKELMLLFDLNHDYPGYLNANAASSCLSELAEDQGENLTLVPGSLVKVKNFQIPNQILPKREDTNLLKNVFGTTYMVKIVTEQVSPPTQQMTTESSYYTILKGVVYGYDSICSN